MTPKHTPTPWKLNIWTSGRYTIESENGQVCEINLIHGPGSPEANAAFIVRVVNAHEELVNTLRIMLNEFAPLARGADKQLAIARAKQAITKAEKGE